MLAENSLLQPYVRSKCINMRHWNCMSYTRTRLLHIAEIHLDSRVTNRNTPNVTYLYYSKYKFSLWLMSQASKVVTFFRWWIIIVDGMKHMVSYHASCVVVI